MAIQNTINHIIFVLDASTSMSPHKTSLIRVADNQIRHLAKRSQELNQETRVTVYTFADAHRIECVIFDMDVLRLPSIATVYQPNGNTALLDAALLAIEDGRQTMTKYGDHAFLVYVLTDGEENASRRPNAAEVVRKFLTTHPDNWTLACLVPDIQGVIEAKRFGFPAGNIMTWDANSQTGVEEAGTAMAATLDSYMTSRATGTRSTLNLFAGLGANIDPTVISGAGLTPLARDKYMLLQIPVIPEKTQISNWVNDAAGRKYRIGSFYYQLTKKERIQAGKKIAIREKGTDKVFHGDAARQLLGLPDVEVRVEPAGHKKYDIFVQSNSINRHLVSGTQLLEML